MFWMPYGAVPTGEEMRTPEPVNVPTKVGGKSGNKCAVDGYPLMNGGWCSMCDMATFVQERDVEDVDMRAYRNRVLTEAGRHTDDDDETSDIERLGYT